MKREIYHQLFIILINISCLSAQTINQNENLVPNPSFENYLDLSNQANTFNQRVKDWQANPPTCSPDYYHKKRKKSMSVPQNHCGIMPARNGRAYVGLIFRAGEHKGDPRDLLYREHISAKLKRPLKENYRYLVKMHIALSSYANYAIANLGVYFSHFPYMLTWDEAINPQIYTPKNQYFDKQNEWILIQDTLIARGGEKFITIGDFNNFENRQIRKITESTEHYFKFNFNRAYYYLDEISVIELDQVVLDSLPEIQIAQNPPGIPKLEIETELGKIEKGKPIILNNIFFEFGKANLLPSSFPELDKLLQLLNAYPQIKIKIKGHTDNIGSKESNQLLSEQRSQSVVTYLIRKGVAIERLKYEGYGENQPIDSNASQEGRQRNRRVEFVVL